jgi:hypothetical protein
MTVTYDSADSKTWYSNPAARNWSCAAPAKEVSRFHQSLPNYAVTPLIELPAIAAELGVGRVFLKDESARMNLSAFKILGAAWAVAQALTDGANPADIDDVKAAIDAENKAKQAAVQAENKRVYIEKYGNVIKEKAAFLATTKATATTTASGLQYVLLQKGTDVKPINGSTIYFKYAGYFEDGNLFDSNFEDVAKTFGQFNQTRADQNGYQAFPFEAGKKDGMIPGFLEGLSF